MAACAVKDSPKVYSLGNTGIWGEAVRQKKAILLNDFKAPHPLKKGLPEGHVPLVRFLTIPIMDAAALGTEAGKVGKANAAVQWLKVFPLPARAGSCEMITGDSPQAIAGSLADKLMADKVI